MDDLDQLSDYYNRKPRRGGKIRLAVSVLGIILSVTGAVALGFYLFQFFMKPPGVAVAPPVISEQEKPETPVYSPEVVPELKYPVGAILITDERKQYRDGEMVLSIPKLNLDRISVLNLADPNVPGGENEVNNKLNEGVGLFYCAQMPETENANVSIAGHRDIHGSEFYYLDTLAEGDIISLEWQGKRYNYVYVDTIIIDPNDPPEVIWAPMMTKDFSAVTLQTCDPINVASHRMFVTGKLDSVEDLE